MGKEEFIKHYCERSGVTWEWLKQYKDALPCACGDEICDGWAMVSKDDDAIRAHMELYAPNERVVIQRHE